MLVYIVVCSFGKKYLNAKCIAISILKKGTLLKNIASVGSALSVLLPTFSYAKTPKEKKPEAVERALETGGEYPLGDKDVPLIEKFDVEGTLDDFITLLYPSSGRMKWVFGLGEGRWGKHKVTHKEFDWKKFESKSFEVLSYDPELASEFATFAESTYEDYGKRFKMHKFDWKNIVALYNTRIDFEQTRLWPGLVPEGLGGFTFTLERDKHKIAFLLEGSKGMFYRIGKHELHHRFSIEKLKEVDALYGAKHEFPTWLEEGGAEFGAIGWDASSEMIIRDAYFNDYFVPISMMDYILGTWLMYKEGQFVSKVITEHFGKDALMKLRENTKLKTFNDNLKASIGIDFSELEMLVNAELSKKYGSLRHEKDFVSRADFLGNGNIMAHHGDTFVVGEMRNKKHPDEDKMYLAYMGKDKRFSTELEHDHDLGRETLHWLVNGAAIDEDTVAYGVRNNEGDVLRIRDFKKGEKKFKLGKVREYRFDNVEIIKHPVFVKDDLVFVGYDKKGYGDLYKFNEKTKKIEKLTSWRKDINSLDYSEKTGKLLLSVEDHEKGLINGIDYNYNLYTLDLERGELERLTGDKENETSAHFSPDGKEIVFTSDKGKMMELYILDPASKKEFKLSDSKVGSFNASFTGEDEIVFHSLKMMGKTMHKTKIPSLESLAMEAGWKGARPEKSFGDLKTKDGSLYVKDEKVMRAILDDEPYLITKDAVYHKEGDAFAKWEKKKEKSLDDVLAKIDNVIASDVSADGESLAVVTNNILSFDHKYPASVSLYSKEGKKLWEHSVKIKAMHSIAGVSNLGKEVILRAGDYWALDEKKAGPLFGLHKSALFFEIGDASNVLATVTSKEHGYFAALVKKKGAKDVVIYHDGKKKVLSFDKESDVTNIGLGSDGELLVASREMLATETTVLSHYDHAKEIFTEVEVKEKGKVSFLDYVHDEFVIKLTTEPKKKSKLPTRDTLVAITMSGENKVLLEDYRKIDNLKIIEGKVFFDAANPGIDESYLYDGKLKKAMDVKDAELEEKILIASDKRRLTVYDLKDGKVKSVDDVAGFEVGPGKLTYIASKDGKKEEHVLSLDDLATEATTTLPIVEELKLTPPRLLAEDKEDAKIVKHSLSKLPFYKSNVSGYGAWSGGTNFLISFDYTGRDLLEDHVVNASFFGTLNSFMLGRALYADLDKGYNLSATFNRFANDIYVGTSAAKIFTLSKYLQMDVSAGYLYAHVKDELIDFEGDNHVIKAGMGIGYDTTKWGILGPKEGVKFFASSEMGFSANLLTLSNFDVNTEARYYVNIIDSYLSLAFRTAAGTSIGEMPTIYRMGGNNTLRGTPLGMDFGNNYFLASAEVRTNLIEVGGLLFRKPLMGLSALTLFPAIEVGVYADVGDTWYYNPFKGNNDNSIAPFELKYSAGFMVNVPTLYGIVLRFSKGVVGEKGFNFWFGVDF